MTPQAEENVDSYVANDIGTDPKWKMEFVWQNVVAHTIINVTALYGLYLLLFWAQWKTIAWLFFYAYMTNIGIAVGAHRHYAHQTYKTVFPVKVLIVILHAAAGQNSMYTWVRDHRQHHKFVDTDADPHNSRRGFFYSHIGWLLMKKHPAVIATGKKLDVSDLKSDRLIMWQYKYFVPLYIIFSIVLPVAVPMYYWNETLCNSYFLAYSFRYGLSLHLTWLVNSAAHMFGKRPYDKDILPVETFNWIGFMMGGEQYHNYHHTFPRDYRASELGVMLNLSALIIEMFAFAGLAYDLRTTPEESIRRMISKSGDGSYKHNSHMLQKLAQE